jgi:hypothetical protein
MNDETFGSSELSNEDRAEEERKRRGQIFSLQHKTSFSFPTAIIYAFSLTLPYMQHLLS